MPSGIYTTTKHRGRPNGSGTYPIRYTNPITGTVSSQSWYLDENGLKKPIAIKCTEHLVDGKWIKWHLSPHAREILIKRRSKKNPYLKKHLSDLAHRLREHKKRGREIQGENEFEDNRRGRADKFIEHFDKQIERYGNKCPITHIPFTMSIFHNVYDINNQVKTFSNVSPDRIFSSINYTKQNLIFTSSLWNLTKQERPISELMLIIKPEIMERYKAIVMERFPDQKYVLQA